jgi:hypothetical protein
VAATLPAGDSGIDLHGRDAGDLQRTSGLATGQVSYPGTADFIDVTFEVLAGVEGIIRHLDQMAKAVGKLGRCRYGIRHLLPDQPAREVHR